VYDGVEGIVLELGDGNPLQARAEALHEVPQEVVSHRPWGDDLLEFERDGVGLEDAHPDRQDGISAGSRRMMIGMFVMGSIINPLIFISTSIARPSASPGVWPSE